MREADELPKAARVRRPIGDLPPDLGVCDACGEIFFAFWRCGSTARTVEERILAGDAERTCPACAKSSVRGRARRSAWREQRRGRRRNARNENEIGGLK